MPKYRVVYRCPRRCSICLEPKPPHAFRLGLDINLAHRECADANDNTGWRVLWPFTVEEDT